MKWIYKILHPDRRSASRWPTESLVAYYWDGSTPMPRRILNVSMSGFYLETPGRWQYGTLITMTIQKTGVLGDSIRPGDYIVLISKVVRADDGGVGVEILPRERAVNTKVRCIGFPANKRAIHHFLNSIREDLHRV